MKFRYAEVGELEKYKLEQCFEYLAKIGETIKEVYDKMEEDAIESRELEMLDEESKKLVEERAKVKKIITRKREEQEDMSDSSFRHVVKRSAQTSDKEVHPTDTIDYRKAFMRFVQTGEESEVLKRANETTTVATDAGAAVPKTVVNEIIKQMDVYGEIWSKIRKLNIKGGVSFPVLTLKPKATWVGEGASESKKLTLGNVVFNYYGLECKIAQTLLASVVTLDAFQKTFVEVAVAAIVQALEIAIVNGTGATNNQPVGIIKDTRVPSGNSITMASTDMGKWDVWKKKVFAKMKKAYRGGVFIMAQGTFDGQIDGMVDANGQPIGRINYGIDGAEKYRFGGKDIITVEEDILPLYDDAAVGDVFAIFVKLDDYAVNSNMEMKTVKWTDHDENTVKNKAIMICDGKLLDPNGVLLIKKGNGATGG